MVRSAAFSAVLLVFGCARTVPVSDANQRLSEPHRSQPPRSALPTFGEQAPQAPAATRTDPLPPERDPAVTDGDKYHVVLENGRVRVLRYQDKPGDKTHPHHHPEFVLYALSAFRRRLTFPDGTMKERDFKPGDVIWMPEQTHIGENTGTTETDVVIVERKAE